MWQAFHRLLEDQNGATAIEYALLASLLSIAVITTVALVGSKLSGSFSNISTAIASTMG